MDFAPPDNDEDDDEDDDTVLDRCDLLPSLRLRIVVLAGYEDDGSGAPLMTVVEGPEEANVVNGYGAARWTLPPIERTEFCR